MTSRLEEVAVLIEANNDKLYKLYHNIQSPSFFIRAALGERSEQEIEMVLDRMIYFNMVLEDIVSWTSKYIFLSKPYISVFKVEVDKLTQSDSKTCDALFEYLSVHMAEKISCSSICKYLNMSLSSLHRFISRIFNMPPYHVVTKYKMYYAKHLVHDKATPVKEAMAACGFTSPSLFAHAYFECFGVLPSDDKS